MDTFYALADPTRRKIIEMLAEHRELSATEIGASFQVSAPAISQHLKVLREAEMVTVEKRAQQRIYKLNPRAMSELEGWTQQVTRLWNARLDALEAVLKEEKHKTTKRKK